MSLAKETIKYPRENMHACDVEMRQLPVLQKRAAGTATFWILPVGPYDAPHRLARPLFTRVPDATDISGDTSSKAF